MDNKQKKYSFSLNITIILVFIIFLFSFFIFPKQLRAAEITSISPTVLTPGVTELTIVGSGFGTYDSEYDYVCFTAGENSIIGPCSVPTDIISWTDTTIKMKVTNDTSPIPLMVGGRIHVYVSYYKWHSFDGPFYYLQPEITSLNTTKAYVGDKIKITGKYLKYALGVQTTGLKTRVFFNDVEGTYTSDGYTRWEITVTVPSGATSGPVSLVQEFIDGSAKVTATGPNIEIYSGTTNDPLSDLQQYIKQVKINNAWNLVPSGQGPVVAIIDDGVYVNHPDLRNNIWINSKEMIGNGVDDDRYGYVDDIYGWDFLSNEGEMTTRGTHGTMVAGIIGAINNNQVGISGINPNVKIMPLIVCDSRSGCSNSAISKAIRYAADNGAKIINISLSTWVTTGYTTELNSAIKYAYDKGVVIVAAAGNGDVEGGIGQDLNIIPQSPVCNDGGNNMVIGVGAVTDNNYLTSWTNFGTNCVDAYAPGVGIVSTAVPAYSTISGLYDAGSGTSFSTPIVTGIVSLLIQKYPMIPTYEILLRIWRNTDGGVINAYKVLSDVYTPPVYTPPKPKILGEEISTPFIVTGTKKGGGPEVRVLTTAGKLLKSFNAYPDTFRGGINVAVGDINGDGTSEIITSTREGGVPTIKVFSPEGKNLGWDFDAYDSKFRGGINIAVGDIEGDGPAEIAVAPMSGGSPNVRIFGMRNGKIVPVSENFLAYDKNFRGGIAISIGGIDGDGIGDIITTPISRGGPHIRVFGVRNRRYVPVTLGIMAYAPTFRGGINSTVGDVNADGRDEIMTGVVSAGGPHIRIFGIGRNKGVGLLSPGFMAYDSAFRGGISVTSIDINDDGYNEIITGVGGNGNPTVRIFNQSGKQVSKEFNAYSTNYKSGITLAAGYF